MRLRSQGGPALFPPYLCPSRPAVADPQLPNSTLESSPPTAALLPTIVTLFRLNPPWPRSTSAFLSSIPDPVRVRVRCISVLPPTLLLQPKLSPADRHRLPLAHTHPRNHTATWSGIDFLLERAYCASEPTLDSKPPKNKFGRDSWRHPPLCESRGSGAWPSDLLLSRSRPDRPPPCAEPFSIISTVQLACVHPPYRMHQPSLAS